MKTYGIHPMTPQQRWYDKNRDRVKWRVIERKYGLLAREWSSAFALDALP